ncbi:MAG: FAD-dependent oxidoreductase [Chloroflexota bacterium]
MASVKQSPGKAADVVVIGYGMAAVVAAITAHDLGAEVVILEKQPQEGHYTTSSLSTAGFIRSNNPAETARFLKLLDSKTSDIPWTNPEVAAVWAEYIADNKDWAEKMGGSVHMVATGGEYPDLPGAQSIEVWQYHGSGIRMMALLYEQVRRRGITVRYGTAARELLKNPAGAVVGVSASTAEGKREDIGAARGVVLACGGFEFDEPLKMNYLRAYPAYFLGSPANTGDGVRMALAAGADLWHMNCCSARWVAKFPEYPWAFTLDLGGKGWTTRLLRDKPVPETAGYIVVDRRGMRFTSENHRLHSLYYELGVYDTQRLEFPRIPSFWIFDQRRMEGGPLANTASGPAGPQQLYRWSQDNRKELEQGWIVSGRTVRELADRAGIPGDSLEKTVTEYHRRCEQGHDPEFKRRPTDLIPLDRPPYYAMKLWPGGANTQGGPRRNQRAQIVNPAGDPIPRLYGAGELGSIYGMLYPSGGCNLAECIAFGRIAGENVSREEPLPARRRQPG